MRRFFGLAFGLGMALAVGASCSRQDAPETAGSGETPTQILRDFLTTESDSGQVRYVMHAQVARVYSGDVTRAEAIRVEFYDHGKQVSVLTAREGVIQGERMTAMGDVVVLTTDGTRLETESLYWDHQLSKIRSEELVRITRKGDPEVLTGRGLTSDPDLEFIDIADPNVTGPVESEQR
jgi:LPS export ABC transporter protein LptC